MTYDTVLSMSQRQPIFNRRLFAFEVMQKRIAGNGKSCRQAAQESGVSPATISRCERGMAPDVETFLRLCRWIGAAPTRYILPETSQSVTDDGKTKTKQKP